MGNIKRLDFFSKNTDEKIVIALGFFDLVHKGHLEIIKKTIKIAKENNAIPTIFTFRNLDSKNIRVRKKEVYDFQKRLELYYSLGLKAVIFADASEDFCNLEPYSFFEKLTENFDIKAIVVGKDYKFGHLGKGDTKTLKEYVDKKNINLFVLDLLKMEENNKKLSSTYIKQELRKGNIEKVNSLLTENYYIKSKVVKGKELGKKIGFPTANFELNKNNLFIQNGVYLTKTEYNNKTYFSITNVGNHPTIDKLKANVETYILDFNQDLYYKEIKVIFFKKIRDVQKFDKLDDLITQLKIDKNKAEEYFKYEKL